MVVSHPYNQGVGKAFNTGLSTALEMGADIMVNIDADGQFSPNDIPLMIKPIVDGKADFVSGNRFRTADGKLVRPDYMSKIKFWGNSGCLTRLALSPVNVMMTSVAGSELTQGSFNAFEPDWQVYLYARIILRPRQQGLGNQNDTSRCKVLP